MLITAGAAAKHHFRHAVQAAISPKPLRHSIVTASLVLPATPARSIRHSSLIQHVSLSATAPNPSETPDGPWTKVIRPSRHWFEIPWREVWRYRDLIWNLASRDVAVSYKQTILGPLWFIVQPLMVTVVFSFLFGRMAKFQSDHIPHYLFYMGGLLPWNYFSESVLKTSNVFVTNANLFSKVYFPRLCVPIAALITNLVPAAAQFGLFLAGLFFYLAKGDKFTDPNWLIIFTPLVFVQLGALALGLGCIISAMSRRFRDFALATRIALQLLMFGSAIVFPLSKITKESDRLIFFLNPIVPPIEFIRLAFVGKSLVEPWHIALSTGVSILVLILGLLLFTRAEQDAMDTV
jgi:lipopolysaccharide transport system permease protein